MANYKKSFSFRHGVQVDNDNFIVNTNGLVGIGTTVPSFLLDVRGNVGVTGLTTITTLSVSGVSTFNDDVKIGTGITFDKSSNTILAPNIKIGTSPTISNVVGYSTVGWIVNETAYGISTSLNVGIHTDAPSDYLLTVGGNPSLDGETGIGVTDGNITATGIVTAASFSGTLNVSDLDGVIGNDHLPDVITSNIDITSGISTFNNVNIGAALTVSGTLTGTASTAQGLTGTPNITVGVTTVSRLKATYIGIGTDDPFCDIQVGSVVGSSDGYGGYSEDNAISVIKAGSIGIGTTNPSEEFEICNNSDAKINMKSGADSKSTVSVGVATTSTSRKGEFEYDASTDILSLKNYSGKDIRFDVTTTNGGSGGIVLESDSTQVFGITSEGKVSINKSSDPVDGHSLEVNGSAKIGGGSSVFGSLTIDAGGNNAFTLTGANQKFPIDPNQNLNSNSGITTLRELHIIDSVTNGINISGAGIGKTVAIGTNTTFFEDDLLTVGTASTFKGDVVMDEDLTIHKDVRIGTGAKYIDEDDGEKIKLIVNNCAEFNNEVSFGTSSITGLTTTSSVAIGHTTDPVGVGSTQGVDFNVPDWASSTRVTFVDLTTGLGQEGFRIRVNNHLEGSGNESVYSGYTMLHFERDPQGYQTFTSARLDWSDEGKHAGCFIGVSSYLTNDIEFGHYIKASGFVDFSVLDPDSITVFPGTPLQVMVNGVVNFESTTGISTHTSQGILNGVVRLGPTGAGTTFSQISVIATGTDPNVPGGHDTSSNFLRVGVTTNGAIDHPGYGSTYITPGKIKVTHSR